MSTYPDYSMWVESIQSSANVEEEEMPLMISGVRIQPGRMIFKDAYDGKRFKQTLTITNCRKSNVNIRIFPPTSKAFNIKPMLLGRTLSAGLSIVRHIKYLYTTPTALPQAGMEIYVDNECVRYEFLVVTCYTQITVSPKILDFGDIDVGLVSEVKKVYITNSGTKQAQYSTDLGQNLLEIVVEPMKGTVQPGECKQMTVEVFGKCEGEFKQEFWIKSDPLQRVQIQGHFIQPVLKVDYPLADKSLLILDFPKTFAGVRQQRNVVIQNRSSTSAVFCVNGRIKSEKIPYKCAVKNDINFKQFEISPLEGSLYRDQKYIMSVTFAPKMLDHQRNYYICNAIVDFRKCRPGGNPCAEQKGIVSEGQGQSPFLLDTISVATLAEEQNELSQEILALNDMVTVLLYGEVELPEVTFTPEKICLKALRVFETHVETLEIRNSSKTLPLVMKFNKVASIEIEPKNMLLPPNLIVKAALKIRPTKIGSSVTRVSLDVFFPHKQNLIPLSTKYLDVTYSGEYTEDLRLCKRRKPSFLPGITPKNCNEVGYLVDDVRFNSKLQKPIGAIVDEKMLVFNKTNDALIALPNDRPRVLKPWRSSVPCKTIFAQLPRFITPLDREYDLTPDQRFLKETTQSYYRHYIGNLNKNIRNEQSRPLERDLEDYVTSDQKKVLLEHIRKGDLNRCLGKKGEIKRSLFVPLTPYEIHNTVVSPKFIQLGRLAANSECSDCFNVENRNGFSIHVSIKALYPLIRIVQEEFILEANSQKDIGFIYRSDRGGTRHIPMVIIVNFFHVFDVTVLATVVANTVRCITKDITIVPTEKTAFLELRNPVNSDVSFEIDTKYFHLESFPTRGVIPAKRNLTLTVTFNPEVGYTPMKEIAVISESGAKELVEVYFDHKKASILLSSEIISFKNVPLNTEITQELTIQNKSDQLVPLTVELENGDLIPELVINPTRDLISQKGDTVLTFTIKFSQVVEFKVPVNLVFQYEYRRQVTITGNVVYPVVNFKPELIKIQKIPSGATVKTPFRILNNTDVSNSLSFNMQDYPEFTVRSKFDDANLPEKTVTLAPKEKRDLILEFRPQEPVAYCIYLPYILNGVLGPPELNCPETLKSDHYLKPMTNQYKIAQELSSEKLKTLKILCAAGKKWLEFSTLELKFCSFQSYLQSFRVSNMSSTPQEVTFKLSDIRSMFNIADTSGNMNVQGNVIQSILEPNDHCAFDLQFLPTEYGQFTRNIPIFVKDYSETDAFNSLVLKVDNPEPCICSNRNSIYFIPTNAGSRQKKEIKLDLTAHRCDKVIGVEYDCPKIEVSLLSRETVSEFTTIVNYEIVFVPTEDCSIDVEICFSCPCSTSTSVEVFACSDKAMVINFLSGASIIDQSTYPLFPAIDDTSNYANMLRAVTAIIERWLYTQGYFYQNFYKVPDDIAKYPVEVSNKTNKTSIGKKTSSQLPLVQLLINLMDKTILKYIDNGLEPSPDLAKGTRYNYVTYRNTISFLKSQDIYVPGLRPEHLLTYREYVEFKSSLEEKGGKKQDEQIVEDIFYRFSKQKWLDLLLGIYKVLVLKRIVDPNSSKSQKPESTSEFIKKDREEFDRYFQDNLSRFPDWFLCDTKLLLWLEYHYNRQRAVLSPKEQFEGVHRLKDFSKIDDGVALAAVTAAYCPYLKTDLEDIYAFPKNIEQKVHNACKVVQCWKSLKLSFDVHPQTIVTANEVKIIFIVTYLYEVLPYFHPTNEVSIEAPLSESETYKLGVQNCGDVPIQYVPIFYGESSNLFKLDCRSIVIPGGKIKSLKITYLAKRVLKASTVLVLSGETGSQRYAKSMAVTITGVPKATSSQEVKFQVETYKLTRQKLKLKTPYGKSYMANIYISFVEPKSYSDLHSVSFLQSNCVAREIDVGQAECEFTEKGEATLMLSMCFLSQGPVQFYLYFCNEKIGDFCVLINIVSNLKKAKAQAIYVEIPKHFKLLCSCKRGLNARCPRTFTVNVPCKNDLLWKSTEVVIRNSFSSSMVRLLERFFGTAVVFRILRFYLEHFPQGFMLPPCLFDDIAEFNISPSNNFSTQVSTIKITDVTTEHSVPLMLHWDQNAEPLEAFLELSNLNEKEVRQYKLIFTPNEEVNDSNSYVCNKSTFA